MGILMTTIDDSIAFKGDRNYLQGPDIFNRLLAFIASDVPGAVATDLHFAAHGFIDTNHVVLKSFSSIEEVAEGEWPSTMTATIGGVPHVVAMKGRAPAAHEALRAPYDEATLQKAMELDGELISFSAPLPHSLIEVAVSMKKKLMQTLFPQEKVKWVFVRADLKALPAEISDRVCVTSRTPRAPSRIYRSSLQVDGVDIGTLYFIGIKQ
jgi:hypothetical protein